MRANDQTYYVFCFLRSSERSYARSYAFPRCVFVHRSLARYIVLFVRLGIWILCFRGRSAAYASSRQLVSENTSFRERHSKRKRANSHTQRTRRAVIPESSRHEAFIKCIILENTRKHSLLGPPDFLKVVQGFMH